MATQSGGGPSTGPSTQQVTQLWEAGYRSLSEGWRQSQEFWNNAARSWGEIAGAWMNQFSRPGQGVSSESAAALRELQDAAFAVGQAWMRLPFVLTGGAQPTELQDAVTRLTQAQGRAYQLWIEALNRTAAAARGAAGEATKAAGSRKS
jgi:hypothetical protein